MHSRLCLCQQRAQRYGARRHSLDAMRVRHIPPIAVPSPVCRFQFSVPSFSVTKTVGNIVPRALLAADGLCTFFARDTLRAREDSFFFISMPVPSANG